MIPLLGRSAVALALVLLLGSGYPDRAVWAADRTDLQIEIVGLDAGNPREVHLKVTNVSPSLWADKTKAHVETVAPTAGNGRDKDIPDLDPGQSSEFTYTLAAACDGHVVKASLSTAGDYKKDKETNLANNVAQGSVCSEDRSTRGEAVPNTNIGSVDLPEEVVLTQIVAFPPQTIELPPRAQSTTWREVHSDTPGCLSMTQERNGQVGWLQQKGLGGGAFLCDVSQLAETAVMFDLETLDQLSPKTIDEAVLRYDEKALRWTDGDGNGQLVPGCVEKLGLATVQWEGRDGDGLFPNEQVLGHTPGVQEWYVTSYVRQMLSGERPRYGFVLRGGIEELEINDYSSCMSTVSNLSLTVTYIVN